jgi:hypothetical protein
MTDVPHLDEIDPRVVMSDSDLQLVKQQFPYAYGIRIHVWGFIDVLFNTQEALDQQRLLPFPARIGALGFAFIIGGHWPTSYSPLTHAIHPDHELNPEPSIKPSILPSTQVTADVEATRRSPSCIGLKISFEGRTYVTTTSHAWITRDEIGKTRKKGFNLALPWTRQSLEPLRQPGRKEGPRTSSVHKEKVQLDSALRPARRPSPLVKMGKWMEHVLQVLRRRSRSHTDDGRIVTSVGVKVYLEGSGFPVSTRSILLHTPSNREQMGEIARTFDTLPQHIGKYLNLFPMAFEHDLSMIEAEEGKVLPRMVVPSWHPSILPQFAPPEKGLRFEVQEKSKEKTKPKPAHAFIVHHQVRNHDRRTGTLVPESAKMVLINGADYFFEGEHLKRSLIWRTEQDDHSVVGMSGSVLLLGKPTDEQVHALIFQNFETLVSDEIYTAAMNTKKPYVGLRSLATLKGGFFLPESVQRHAFIKVEREEDLSRTLSYNQKNDKTSPLFIPPSTSDPVN